MPIKPGEAMFFLNDEHYGETPIVPADQVRRQLELRSRHSRLVGILLDVQQENQQSDEVIYGQLACYLSDALESTTRKYMDLLMRMPPEPMEVNGKKYVYVGPPWLEVKPTRHGIYGYGTNGPMVTEDDTDTEAPQG